jgi:hypothetical protein
MHGTTLQGRVENGQIKLPDHVQLPDNTLVYVVIPASTKPASYVASPRLAHPEQAADFELEVVEGTSDAGV